MRIQAALFDFGGVFTESPFDVTHAISKELGAHPETLMEILFGPYHEDTDHPWHRVERGELGLEAARDEIVALGEERGIPADPFQVFARMAQSSREARSEVVDRVRALQSAGVATALVTNNAKEFRAGWRRLIPVDELFDVVIDSSEVGLRKPDPRIFHLTLERLGGVDPSSSIFLDDYEGNVSAANRLGIRGILVESDPSSALAQVDALLA